MADDCRPLFEVEEAVQGTPAPTHGEAERAATASLRVQPIRAIADFPGYGQCRQRRCYPARHVWRHPEGCEVFSFKQPSAEELEHDFLWRTTCRLPERGRIGIFNRSYYEEVLVVRVHPEILRSQGLPEELRDEKDIWEQRYVSIVDLEKHLHRNGTRIVKVFLHLSYEEQRKRFLERIDEPERTGNSAPPTSTSGNTGNTT